MTLIRGLYKILCIIFKEVLMPFPAGFEKKINFLIGLDPNKDSVGINANKEFVHKETSCIRNFFRWVIHIISLTKVPLNKKLDQVAQEILNQSKEVKDNQITNEEKRDFLKAISNLQEIIKRNYGKEGEKIQNLLATINKIQTLDAVEDLKEKDAPVIIPVLKKNETPLIKPILNPEPKQPIVQPKKAEVPNIVNPIIAKNEKLQKLERDLNFNYDEAKPFLTPEQREKIMKEIVHILPELDVSEDLSKKEIFILRTGLIYLDKEWVIENAKKLHPNTIQFLVSKSLERNCEQFISNLLLALVTEPIDQKKLIAFVRGFPVCNKEHRQNRNFVQVWDDLNSGYLLPALTPEVIEILKNNLPQDEVLHFINSLWSFIALSSLYINEEQFKNSPFMLALNLIDDFGPKYQQIILNSLCHSFQTEAVIKILLKCLPEDNIIETILKLHSEEDDPQNLFFDRLIAQLFLHQEQLPKMLSSLMDFVFNNCGQERQMKLAKQLTPNMVVSYINHIPLAIFERFQNFGDIGKEIMRHPDPNRRNKAIQYAASTFEKRNAAVYLFDQVKIEEIDLFAAILPLCKKIDTQQRIVKNLIKAYMILDPEKEKLKNLVDEAIKLPLNLWEEASKDLKIKDFGYLIGLPAKQCAAVVNGQINNKEFLINFFHYRFGFKEEEGLEYEVEEEYLEQLKPEALEFETKFFVHDSWIRFFDILNQMDDQEQAKKLLISSTKSLFKNKAQYKELFFALTPEQMKILPIKEYCPIISLQLAILTDKLKDPEILAFLKDTFKIQFNDEIDLIKNLTPDILLQVFIPLLKDLKDLQIVALVERLNKKEEIKEICKQLGSLSDHQILDLFIVDNAPAKEFLQNALKEHLLAKDLIERIKKLQD